MRKCSKNTLRIAGCLALLLACPLFLHHVQPPARALTLERPSVNVDWNKVPARPQSSRPKLVYSTNRLFGTVEFRSPIKNLAQWERILRLYGNRKSIDDDFAKSGRTAEKNAWEKLKGRAGGMEKLELLSEVNKFFNRWPYRSDMDVYGLIDYWSTPAEFLKKSGDCEDYAITKFFALIQLGVNPSDMRVVILKDKIRNMDHAVLAVYLGKEVYILDNTSPMVLPHSRYGHYQPVVSVNLEYRWAHVPPSK